MSKHQKDVWKNHYSINYREFLVRRPFLRLHQQTTVGQNRFPASNRCIQQLDSRHLLSTGVVTGQHHSWATIWGWGPGGRGHDHEIGTRTRFLTMQLPTKFYHPIFTHTHTQPFYGSMDFVRDNPDEPLPEETFTHSHLSWSSIVPYLLYPSTTIHGILPVQSTCLTVFLSTISL